MSTRTRTLLASAALAAVGGLATSTLVAGPATAADGGRPLSAMLSGGSEVPGPGDADGAGTASVRVNPGQGRVCVDLTVTGIAPATAAHIHESPAGVAGPVIIALSPPTGGMSSGCVTVSRTLAREILRTPADYYVNVHNAEFPGGAVRGQLG